MTRTKIASLMAGLSLLAATALGLTSPGHNRAEAAASQTGSWKPQAVPPIDGGNTWYDSYTSSGTVPLWGLAASTGGAWAVGTSGRVVRRPTSCDYCVADVSSPTVSTLWATAAAPGTSIGWAVGNDGVVVKT